MSLAACMPAREPLHLSLSIRADRAHTCPAALLLFQPLDPLTLPMAIACSCTFSWQAFVFAGMDEPAVPGLSPTGELPFRQLVPGGSHAALLESQPSAALAPPSCILTRLLLPSPSPAGEAFLAGVLHHLPALMAFTAPSPNSYRRIEPHAWAGAFQVGFPTDRAGQQACRVRAARCGQSQAGASPMQAPPPPHHPTPPPPPPCYLLCCLHAHPPPPLQCYGVNNREAPLRLCSTPGAPERCAAMLGAARQASPCILPGTRGMLG